MNKTARGPARYPDASDAGLGCSGESLLATWLDDEGVSPDDDRDHQKRGCSQGDDEFACLGERLLKTGRDTLADCEILRLVLGQVALCDDSDIFLEALLTRFRGFSGVIGAPAGTLAAIDGLGKTGAVALKSVQAGALRLLEIEVPKTPVISCWNQLIAYLRAEMAFGDVEEVRIIYLDSCNRVVTTESQGRGSVRHAIFYPREVIQRALELNASALIIAHNHPSGDPTPSREDVAVTTDLVVAASAVEVAVHDHLVVGRFGCFSFREHQLL